MIVMSRAIKDDEEVRGEVKGERKDCEVNKVEGEVKGEVNSCEANDETNSCEVQSCGNKGVLMGLVWIVKSRVRSNDVKSRVRLRVRYHW